MLPAVLKNSFMRAYRFLLMLIAVLYALPVYSQATTPALPLSQPGSFRTLSVQQMLVNIAHQIPQLMQLVTALAYVMGMYFIIVGILKLKQYGEARSMMSTEHSIKGPLIFLTIGSLLLYLPTSVEVGLSTFWTNPNPYGYEQYTDPWSQFLRVAFLVIQFIGTIAFIRGLVILTHLGGHGGSQPGTFSRGLTHIIGGILCINIYETIRVIMLTIGIQT